MTLDDEIAFVLRQQRTLVLPTPAASLSAADRLNRCLSLQTGGLLLAFSGA